MRLFFFEQFVSLCMLEIKAIRKMIVIPVIDNAFLLEGICSDETNTSAYYTDLDAGGAGWLVCPYSNICATEFFSAVDIGWEVECAQL